MSEYRSFLEKGIETLKKERAEKESRIREIDIEIRVREEMLEGVPGEKKGRSRRFKSGEVEKAVFGILQSSGKAMTSVELAEKYLESDDGNGKDREQVLQSFSAFLSYRFKLGVVIREKGRIPYRYSLPPVQMDIEDGSGPDPVVNKEFANPGIGEGGAS